jgi:hypothetical protein
VLAAILACGCARDEALPLPADLAELDQADAGAADAAPDGGARDGCFQVDPTCLPPRG